MPRCGRRGAALVAVLALLLAAPFERGRGCDVCPHDCPMHATRPAPGRVGCHQARSTPPPSAHADAGDCAMRATCGHHTHGIVAFFHAEPPAPRVVTPVPIARPLALARVPVDTVDPSSPPAPPPRSSVG